jgi:predicted outer membrane protein
MHMSRRLSLTVSVAALSLFINSNVVTAQIRENGSPTDVKPAQASSPAAHPTESASRNGSNVNGVNQNTVTTDRERDSRGEGKSEGGLNRQIAACLLDKNKGEVELGKMAAERTEHKDVKEFAEKMVKEHSKMVEKLQRIAGDNTPTDRRSKIEHQIAERCLENLKKELSDKSGREFDAGYIGSQIGGHMEMLSTLEVLADETSGELRDVVKEGELDVKKHLSMAKDIMKELDKTGRHDQASRDRSESNR